MMLLVKEDLNMTTVWSLERVGNRRGHLVKNGNATIEFEPDEACSNNCNWHPGDTIPLGYRPVVGITGYTPWFIWRAPIKVLNLNGTRPSGVERAIAVRQEDGSYVIEVAGGSIAYCKEGVKRLKSYIQWGQ